MPWGLFPISVSFDAPSSRILFHVSLLLLAIIGRHDSGHGVDCSSGHVHEAKEIAVCLARLAMRANVRKIRGLLHIPEYCTFMHDSAEKNGSSIKPSIGVLQDLPTNAGFK